VALVLLSGVAVNLVIVDYSVEYVKRSRQLARIYWPALIDPRASTGHTARTAQADRPTAARGHRKPTCDGALALRAHLDRGAEGPHRAERPLGGGEHFSKNTLRSVRRC
jgi:hypothetical protein